MLDLLKIAIILVAAPLWVPFAKAMMREILDLFEEDGGLFGDDPGPLRRAALQAQRASRPSVLVHEWLAHVRTDVRRNVVAPGQAPQGAPARPTGRVAPAAQRAMQQGQRAPQAGQRSTSSGTRDANAGPPRRSFR